MGHFYGALAILVISVSLYRGVIILKRKELQPERRNLFFIWMDWYFFCLIFYALLPYIFLRRDLAIELLDLKNSEIVESFLYKYHGLILQVLLIVGLFLFICRMKQGFGDY